MTAARLLPCLLLLALAGCGVTQVVDRDPAGRPILIRTPQPDADDLVDLHEDHRVRTVLNLRGEQPEKGWFQEEAEGVKRIGARWVHIDTSGRSPPDPAQVEAFFDLVEDPDARPIVMHCQGGIHRTGAFSALYRMQYQGWSNERAVEEMEDLWFDWTTTDRDRLKRWLLEYRPVPRRRTTAESAESAEGGEE